MLLTYNRFNSKQTTVNEGVLNDMEEKSMNKIIDDTFEYFKKNHIKVNTKDIFDHVEQVIGKELDDDDYSLLYYKITGNEINSDEIDDLDEEEKFYIR